MARRKRRITTPHLEVSLTPLIDTALTLLIIFMVTTPMIQNSILINLPKGHAKEGGTQAQELVVTIDRNEKIYFNNNPIEHKQLSDEIRKVIMPEDQEKRVWVKVDEACSTKCLIETIDSIKIIGGVKDVAIATEQARAA